MNTPEPATSLLERDEIKNINNGDVAIELVRLLGDVGKEEKSRIAQLFAQESLLRTVVIKYGSLFGSIVGFIFSVMSFMVGLIYSTYGITEIVINGPDIFWILGGVSILVAVLTIFIVFYKYTFSKK